jgi:small subunit ribosomal protein S29
MYTQNVYTASWLSQISRANADLLSGLELTQSPSQSLPNPLPASSTTVQHLADLGARDPEVAWPVFQAVWRELTAPGRPPVLLALDGLVHAMTRSAYRDPSFAPIHAHDLAVVAHFVDHLAGRRPLPNGGLVLAATSSVNPVPSQALSLALARKADALAGAPADAREVDPFVEHDERAAAALRQPDLVALPGLNHSHAMNLLEYWAKSGLLRATVDSKLVAEKWVVAGHGIVGELERDSLRLRI